MKAKEHYDNLLAEYYTWMSGGTETKLEENREFFSKWNITPALSGKAADLGAGSGFQSIPLAEAGFDVTAVDFNKTLLKELSDNCPASSEIRIVTGDILEFLKDKNEVFELVVCMGDTITHLESLESVKDVLRSAFSALEPGGKLILSFRDMSKPASGLDRFIPVRSDGNAIFTCFLEDTGEKILVHDLVYTREDGSWILRKSCYEKLKISAGWVKAELKEAGFRIAGSDSAKGFFTLIAKKG